MMHLGLMLLLASGSAAASPCLFYGKVTIDGVLSRELSVQGDHADSWFVVSPAAPLCIDAGKGGPAVSSVTQIEIEINRKGGWPLMVQLDGHPVSCYGDLLDPEAEPSKQPGHQHHTAVVLRGMCRAPEPAIPK